MRLRLAGLLVVVAVLAVSAPAAAIQTFTVDADHGLARPSAVDDYERTGYVSTSLVAPDLTIEIAEEHERVDVDATRADAPYHYLRLRYNETLPAVFRVHVPSGYWHPQPQNVESIADDATAELRPDPDGEVTVVTVRFDGRTDAVFPVPKTASWVFATRDYTGDILENQTSVEIPSLGSRSEWHYVDESRLHGNNATVKLLANEDLVVQYDAGRRGERWLPVPDCTSAKGEDHSVCRFTREGVDEHVFLLLRTEDPPAIRYKTDTGPLDSVRSLGDGIAVSIDNLMNLVGRWLGVG